jgi:pantothenate kinase
MEFETRRCEDGIVDSIADSITGSIADSNNTGGLFFCVDCGTTYIKTLLLDKTGTVYNRYGYDNFPYDKIARMAELNKCKIIITGARSDALDMDNALGLDGAHIDYTKYTEIECISMLPGCLGIERALVASIGTGTPFVAVTDASVNNDGIHLGGTGIGGGTFIGLAERMLGVSDPAKVEEMAANGDITNVNIMVGDIYKDIPLNDLKSDYTASNFAKSAPKAVGLSSGETAGEATGEGSGGGSGEAPEDIAIGIHRLVAEVVGAMAGQLAKYNGFDTVIFCGSVCDNKIICRTLDDCCKIIYGVRPIYIEHPGFGACFGGIARFIKTNSV